jgi:hypothetical protein
VSTVPTVRLVPSPLLTPSAPASTPAAPHRAVPARIPNGGSAPPDDRTLDAGGAPLGSARPGGRTPDAGGAPHGSARPDNRTPDADGAPVGGAALGECGMPIGSSAPAGVIPRPRGTDATLVPSPGARGDAPLPARARPAPRAPGERAPVGLVVDPDQASMMVAIAAVEVLSGARQQVQLARWLLPEVYEALGQRAALSAAGAPASAPRAAGSPRVGPVGARAGGTLGVPTPGVGARIGASRPRARSGPAAGGGPAASATGRPEMVGGTIAAQGLRAVVRALRMMRVDED